MRSTGNYATSTTMGEPVQAFVPHKLPPSKPVLAPECYVEANRAAELALARLSGVAGLVPSVDWLLNNLGIVTELTGQKKNRSYSYAAFIALLAE